MRYSYILIMFALISCGGSKNDEETVVEQNNGLKLAESVLIIIAQQDFQDEEFKEPYELFTKSGAKVIIASTDTLPSKGMLGLIVKPDIKFEQVMTDSFDVLIVVGGSGCRLLWDNAVLHRIIREFNAANKIIGAICIAPVILGRAGILKDMEVTAFPSVEDDIGKCGGCFIDSDIAVCNNIITGSGPKAAKTFAQTILNEIGDRRP